MQHVEPKTIKNPTPAIAVDVGDNWQTYFNNVNVLTAI